MGKNKLIAYTDYAWDQDERKSTPGYIFYLGSEVDSWSFRKQPIISLSTTDAEFIDAASCDYLFVWVLE